MGIVIPQRRGQPTDRQMGAILGDRAAGGPEPLVRREISTMAQSLRICLFNTDASAEESLQPEFEKLRNVRVLAEVSTWDDLHAWLVHKAVDIVVVKLNDDVEAGLEVVRNVAQISPGCAVIGVSAKADPTHIISAMRAGCAQFVCWPVDTEDLRSAVDRISSGRGGATISSKRICVISSSGGAGATTIACNLALELADIGHSQTALVDLSLEFGDVHCVFDCRPEYSVADVCREGVDLDVALLDQAMHELSPDVSILARPEILADAREVTPDGVDNALRLISQMYPYLVVDLPRAFSFLSAAALRDADHVLIVTQLGVPFVRNARRIYDCLREMDTDPQRIEIVLNRCKANFERVSPEDVEAHFDKPIFAMIPNDYRHVQSALDLGNPIGIDPPNSPARAAIQALAKKLVADDATEGSTPSKRGLIGRLLKR